MEWLWRLIGGENGEDVVEYALALVLVSLVAFSVIIATGQSVGALWVGVCQPISQVAGGAVPCS